MWFPEGLEPLLGKFWKEGVLDAPTLEIDVPLASAKDGMSKLDVASTLGSRVLSFSGFSTGGAQMEAFWVEPSQSAQLRSG